LPPSSGGPPPKVPGRGGLRIIAAFKFVKAIGLIAAGLGALRLLDPGRAAGAQDWLEGFAFGHHTGAALAADALKLLNLGGTNHFGRLAAGAFILAALYVVEGIGLALARRWAEYLTVVVGISFLPIEVLALSHGLTLPRILALALNIAVVWYLIVQLRRVRAPVALDS
jgi:uncharacterized membrane protein (DUF2068 family)